MLLRAEGIVLEVTLYARGFKKMKRYDVAALLLISAPVYGKFYTSDTAGKILFFYVLARVVYSALFSER